MSNESENRLHADKTESGESQANPYKNIACLSLRQIEHLLLADFAPYELRMDITPRHEQSGSFYN